MKITFNNHHNNNDAKKQKSQEINIEQNCVITNYNPNEVKNPQGAGYLTLSVNDGNVEYKKGQSIFNEDVKLNQTKYSVFTKIVSMDGNDSDLTEEDLSKARKDYDKNKQKWINLGVTKFSYDPDAGIATIKIGDTELLRIDFETDKEKAARLKSKPASQTTAAADTGKTQASSTTQTAKPKPAETNNTTEIADSIRTEAERRNVNVEKHKINIYKAAKIIAKVSTKYDVQPALFVAIIGQETNGKFNNVNSSAGSGLMQLTQSACNDFYDESRQKTLKLIDKELFNDIFYTYKNKKRLQRYTSSQMRSACYNNKEYCLKVGLLIFKLKFAEAVWIGTGKKYSLNETIKKLKSGELKLSKEENEKYIIEAAKLYNNNTETKNGEPICITYKKNVEKSLQMLNYDYSLPLIH